MISTEVTLRELNHNIETIKTSRLHHEDCYLTKDEGKIVRFKRGPWNLLTRANVWYHIHIKNDYINLSDIVKDQILDLTKTYQKRHQELKQHILTPVALDQELKLEESGLQMAVTAVQEVVRNREVLKLVLKNKHALIKDHSQLRLIAEIEQGWKDVWQSKQGAHFPKQWEEQRELFAQGAKWLAHLHSQELEIQDICHREEKRDAFFGALQAVFDAQLNQLEAQSFLPGKSAVHKAVAFKNQILELQEALNFLEILPHSLPPEERDHYLKRAEEFRIRTQDLQKKVGSLQSDALDTLEKAREKNRQNLQIAQEDLETAKLAHEKKLSQCGKLEELNRRLRIGTGITEPPPQGQEVDQSAYKAAQTAVLLWQLKEGKVPLSTAQEQIWNLGILKPTDIDLLYPEQLLTREELRNPIHEAVIALDGAFYEIQKRQASTSREKGDLIRSLDERISALEMRKRASDPANLVKFYNGELRPLESLLGTSIDHFTPELIQAKASAILESFPGRSANFYLSRLQLRDKYQQEALHYTPQQKKATEEGIEAKLRELHSQRDMLVNHTKEMEQFKKCLIRLDLRKDPETVSKEEVRSAYLKGIQHPEISPESLQVLKSKAETALLFIKSRDAAKQINSSHRQSELQHEKEELSALHASYNKLLQCLDDWKKKADITERLPLEREQERHLAALVASSKQKVERYQRSLKDIDRLQTVVIHTVKV